MYERTQEEAQARADLGDKIRELVVAHAEEYDRTVSYVYEQLEYEK